MNTVCDRDWPEDFEHENGEYMNTCCECKNTFTGHKRRFICKACSTSQGGEAVEVVGWRHWGDKTRLLCDLGKQRAIPGTIADEFTVPLMEVTQHQRILSANVAKSDPVGVVFTMEALAPGGGVKSHASLSRELPAGTKLYTHPADQVAEGARALLERTLPYLNNTPDLVQFGAEELAVEIRALLTSPSPQ